MANVPVDIKAVLFDMDGVIASVGTSYREAIIRTATSFSCIVTHDDITVEKKRGDSNNDWKLSRSLIQSTNVVSPLAHPPSPASLRKMTMYIK
jgi:ribonucleotide monophosphatase NagD (HAD superfamily)